MGRLLAIDYGRRRCGIAATDVSRIVATGIGTIATSGLTEFLRGYFAKETVDLVVVAMIDGGMRKSRRQVKGEADVMAATIILNDFLESQAYRMTLN